ncbi:MAG: hypothetical protein DRJ96_06935 [Thermoprotei archaeon]|nr:hypothetical protein [Thermoproteales archaeon]RLE96323.1 MAG: hypothetical protein DRJ96_06935 [Thermoprotei archaeon]
MGEKMGAALHARVHGRRGGLSRLELIRALRRAGLTSREIAEILGESPEAVRRELEELIVLQA